MLGLLIDHDLVDCYSFFSAKKGHTSTASMTFIGDLFVLYYSLSYRNLHKGREKMVS